MNGSYLLDTNIVIALFADEGALKDRIGATGEFFVSSVVLGELYYGANKSQRVAKNTARIDDFAARNVVLGCDTETARCYGDVKERLRQKGRPIPENDIWIAAQALQNDLTLVARDAHFKEVEGLSLETW
jgi:tRNA(fMet)-specific endonuclease VapC